MLKEFLSDAVIVLGMAAIAAGRVPFLRMNRAAIAVAAAAILVAVGALPLADALGAIDPGTIALLFSMMVIVASLKRSGFFDAVSARLARLAGYPKAFLAAVILAAGALSALFLNDTMCIVLGPVVAETCIRARRRPAPYLVAVATAANVGSAATIIGNPQNMLIGARSGLGFSEFFASMAPVAAAGLAVCWLVIVAVFPREFWGGQGAPRDRADATGPSAPVMGHESVDVALAAKSLAASGAMLLCFVLGVPTVLSAIVPAAFLLCSRKVESRELLDGVDYSLLVFFSGLFVMTEAAARTGAFLWLERGALAKAAGSPWLFSAATAAVSNIVSNVPAVMVLSPLAGAAASPRSAWLLLAMASTFAGNLTLLGSVANLIVAEGAAGRGARLGFWDYLKAGLPITAITLAMGTWWLGMAG